MRPAILTHSHRNNDAGLVYSGQGQPAVLNAMLPQHSRVITSVSLGLIAEDPGRAGVTGEGVNGAFKVPTLRNIALTAPYMHNGSMATLQEVVEFYADGGGNAHGAENVDIFVQGFDLTDQEKSDLVAFMMALTDESGLPEIPASVPSGLPIVERTTNPAQEIVADYEHWW